jgi:hypothetical protein
MHDISIAEGVRRKSGVEMARIVEEDLCERM